LLREKAENLGVGGLNTKERAFDYPNYGDDFRLTWTHFPSGNTMNEFRILFSTDHYEMKTDQPDSWTIDRPSGGFGKDSRSTINSAFFWIITISNWG
jgi:hypothetical protein